MKDDDAWMAQGTGTNEKPNQRGTTSTTEQRAARLAEVYKTAFREARGVLRRDMASSLEEDRDAAHEIAMLLVGRELEAGDG